jgi:hypothetical protein
LAMNTEKLHEVAKGHLVEEEYIQEALIFLSKDDILTDWLHRHCPFQQLIDKGPLKEHAEHRPPR